MKREFTIYVDHFQFYLEAEGVDPDFERLWDKTSIAEGLAASYGVIAVGTARYGGDTHVVLEVLDARPAGPLDEWDKVMECSIEVLSGSVVLSTPEMGIFEETRTPVSPGVHQALVYYGNQHLVPRNGADIEGDDHYRIALWPGEITMPRTVK